MHQPREWIDERAAKWPAPFFEAVVATGEPVGDLTDALGITGSDATCPYTVNIPAGKVFFAGAPVRTGKPAPDDLKIYDRGDFAVAWSPSLRHPLWCAYHVPAEKKYEPDPKRPPFERDKSVASSPRPSDYTRSGYDRGHMAPNYAIASRFGREMQKKTFLMSNISPQRPALNRGVWRDVEHRIAKTWTARWGEIWVIAGAIPGSGKKIPGTEIDIPHSFWQVVAAVKDGEMRAFAVLIDQNVGPRAWPTRYILTIRELEALAGLDFFPELDKAKQDEIETKRPTRLWPVNFFDAFAQLCFRGI